MKRKSLVGKTYGRLSVLSEVEPHMYPSGQTQRMYKCKCACGKELIVQCSNLISGNTMSCGCLKSDYARKLVPNPRPYLHKRNRKKILERG